MAYIGNKPDETTRYVLPPGIEGHDSTIASEITLGDYDNHVSMGDITVVTGGQITIPSGKTWTII
tara:strand:- start:2564 stop:2758 length:195 start_codon:yes stop_codon:yes gene_type:complete